MAGNFSVTSSNLSNGASQLEELNGQFKNAVAELENTEASLSSMWEGEARNAFHKIFTEDKGQMDNFYNLIVKYVEALRTISANYAQAEQTNTDTASSRSAY